MYTDREKALIWLFENSELWAHMGYESVEDALDEMDLEEVEALLEQEYHNLEHELKEIMLVS